MRSGLDEAFKVRASAGNHQTRIGAELASALGEGSDEALRQGFGSRLQCRGEQQDRVDRAHFRVHRDRLGACLGGVAQGNAAAARAGETHGLDARISDKGDAHFAAGAEQQRKHAFVQSAKFDRTGQRPAHQLTGAGVCAMGLDDHRATGGQRRRGVTAGDGEGQGKVAGAEHRHRAERHLTLTQVRARQGLTLRLRGVDPYIEPFACADGTGKGAQLLASAAPFTLDTRAWQAGLGHGTVDQLIAEGFDFVGDGFEESGAGLQGRCAVAVQGTPGQGAGLFDVFAATTVISRFKG
ncbi:hypothetical protein D3C87_1342450 [compost metagenome]